jgi:hypothetical protein
LGLAFFTLPSNYTQLLHGQIWELIQFGNGFTWKDVYFMPIQWRKFYFNKLIELKKKEAEEHKKAQSKSKVRVNR